MLSKSNSCRMDKGRVFSFIYFFLFPMSYRAIPRELFSSVICIYLVIFIG